MAPELALLVRPGTVDHLEDVSSLLRDLRDAGFDASLPDIEWAWRSVSASFASVWLFLDIFRAEERVSQLRDYLEESIEVPAPRE